MVRDLALAFAAVALAIALHAAGANAGDRINAEPGGVAVKGYDVVAYFTMGAPTKGEQRYTHLWQGVRWQFVNAEHREAFASEPSRYAPRYGGFCAGGMARGNLATIDPEAFVIVDGKLYLNFDKSGAASFEANAPSRIADANANWQVLGNSD